MPRYPNETVPSQFRLGADTIAHLDAISLWLTADSGVKHNRTDAIRWLAAYAAKRILPGKTGTKRKPKKITK
jgi:hypothetical protein